MVSVPAVIIQLNVSRIFPLSLSHTLGSSVAHSLTLRSLSVPRSLARSLAVCAILFFFRQSLSFVWYMRVCLVDSCCVRDKFHRRCFLLHFKLLDSGVRRQHHQPRRCRLFFFSSFASLFSDHFFVVVWTQHTFSFFSPHTRRIKYIWLLKNSN